MNAAGRFGCMVALLCTSSALPDEPVRVLCDPAGPANECPGPRCRCAPDGLEVEFRGPGGPTFTYDEFREGMEVEMSVVLAAESPGIQGFAFGVAHDPHDVEILFADTGPDLAGLFHCELCPGNWPVLGTQTCGDDPECAPENRAPGGGWIFAAILPFNQQLPLGRQHVASGRYRLLRDVGSDGTRIRFSDRLGREGSPSVTYQLTVLGVSRVWSYARDGLIRRTGTGAGHFRRGDANGDGRVNVTDPLWMILGAIGRLGRDAPCARALDADDDSRADLVDAVFLLQHLFAHGPPPPTPGLECGADATADDLDCQGSSCP